MSLFDADPFSFEEQPPLEEPPGEKARTHGDTSESHPDQSNSGEANTAERREVWTDGACKGNPGPGGWGWVIPDQCWSSGAENPSTNQRMEVEAVLHAIRSLEGPLEIVSDSTYVVNCFKDGWWRGWERRGWKNSQKKAVANQDLWKPLISLYKERDVTFRWVKGHAGNRWNEKADELAVAAAEGNGAAGEIFPL